MISRGIVPNLVIARRVVERVIEAAKHYLADETGETMVGFVVPAEDTPESMPTLYVLDTISPDENAIRRSHMFEQGDELQQDIFFWLSDNWDTYREIGKDLRGRPIQAAWNQPLRHMGDWHKQPGFMIQPSGGDLMTALRFMEDEENDFDFLLVPIVTLGHDSVTNEEGAQVNYFTVALPDGTSLRMDWWYIHRDSRFFQPITPRIVPDDQLPELTPYPWHILDEELVNDELDILEVNGYFRVGDFVLWNTDDKPPLEICFIIGRPGTSQVYLVVTDWDYPRTPPRVYLSQFKDIDMSMYIYDIWKRLWEQRTPPPSLADFKWTHETFVVDLIKAVETAQGLAHPTPPRRAEPPASGPVRIPVQVEDKKIARPTPPTDDPAKDDVE